MTIDLRQLLLLIDMAALWAPLMMMAMEKLWAPLTMMHHLQIAGVAGVAVELPLGVAEGAPDSAKLPAGPDMPVLGQLLRHLRPDLARAGMSTGPLVVLSVAEMPHMLAAAVTGSLDVPLQHRDHQVQNTHAGSVFLLPQQQQQQQPQSRQNGGAALQLRTLDLVMVMRSRVLEKKQLLHNVTAVENLVCCPLTSPGWMLSSMPRVASTPGWHSYLCSSGGLLARVEDRLRLTQSRAFSNASNRDRLRLHMRALSFAWHRDRLRLLTVPFVCRWQCVHR